MPRLPCGLARYCTTETLASARSPKEMSAGEIPSAYFREWRVTGVSEWRVTRSEPKYSISQEGESGPSTPLRRGSHRFRQLTGADFRGVNRRNDRGLTGDEGCSG